MDIKELIAEAIREHERIHHGKANPTEEQLAVFEEARKLYPNTKRGRDAEFADFAKKHKNWADFLPLLRPAILKQIEVRKERDAAGEWTPQWKSFKSWLFNSYWQLELKAPDTPRADIDLAIERARRETDR